MNLFLCLKFNTLIKLSIRFTLFLSSQLYAYICNFVYLFSPSLINVELLMKDSIVCNVLTKENYKVRDSTQIKLIPVVFTSL